jgi:hypothetical protein
MAKVLTKEMAIADVNRWLDYKKIGDKKRSEKQDHIEALVEAVSEGDLIVEENCTITQKLKFPTEGGLSVSEFVYKPRVSAETVIVHMNGVKPTDIDNRIVANIAALTSQPKAIIKKLDTEDLSIAQSIVIFFL